MGSCGSKPKDEDPLLGEEKPGQPLAEVQAAREPDDRHPAEGGGSSSPRAGGILGSDREPEAERPLPELLPLEKLTVEHLMQATGNLSDANVMCLGTLGKLYKGTFRGKDIVAKQIDITSQSDHEFLEEIGLARRLNHPSIVRLLGYCLEPGHRVLAVEYAPLGSLYRLLHGKKGSPPPVPLTWGQRLSIMQGAAEGLAFLHQLVVPMSGGGLVHKRVKATNVLVFDGYAGKISDCDLRGPWDKTYAPPSSQGETVVYDAPELNVANSVTQKSDVYSFGVLLMEVLCGKKTMFTADDGRTRTITDWALRQMTANHNNIRSIVDPSISSASDESLETLFQLALKCSSFEPEKRPEMKEVVEVLRSIQKL